MAKRLWWMGLIEGCAMHAVTVGGHSISQTTTGGKGGFAELTDEEAVQLQDAIHLKAITRDPSGRPFVVDLDEATGKFPENATPLADVSWLQPYEPDRSHEIRKTQPDSLTGALAKEDSEAEKKASGESEKGMPDAHQDAPEEPEKKPKAKKPKGK